MTHSPLADRRQSQRSTTDQSHANGDDCESAEISSLTLSRTKSQDPAAVESIAVSGPVLLDNVAESKPSKSTQNDSDNGRDRSTRTKYLVLLCALITSLSFGVTQVPLLYIFRLMTCDAYYEEHPSQEPAAGFPSTYGQWLNVWATMSDSPVLTDVTRDRCSVHQIESSTALAISVLGASTTVFGLFNLFLTGILIKRIGVKPTLVIQVFFPAVRLFIQNIGVEVWGKTGINIIQLSQFFTIVGGPSGYILGLNTFMTEIVEHEGRTAALGRLQGTMMFGSAFGFLIGGLLADSYGIHAPFRLTLLLFLLCSIYVAIFLPHIPPTGGTGRNETKKNAGLVKQFFSPLTVFAPRKFVTVEGQVRNEFGALLLAVGVYLGILATGYLPTLLQLYATDVFSFGTSQNGWLIFVYSTLRGVFLAFVFPQLIALGRKWMIKREEEKEEAYRRSPEQQPLLTQSPNLEDHSETKVEQTFVFDLVYTRFSLIADGLLTLLCTFVHQGWQMYLIAVILPLSAGTSSAAKGTILQMVGASASSDERTDALAGISLVENMARLSTSRCKYYPFRVIRLICAAFVFGVIFAAFASIGRTELVFTCNAAIAIIGFGVLVFARFPPRGSRRVDHVLASSQ